MSTGGKTGRPMGRPAVPAPKPLTLKKAVAKTGSTKGAAIELGMNYRTLERQMRKDPELRAAYARGKELYVKRNPRLKDTHGTLQCYRYHDNPDGSVGCRCTKCRKANREWIAGNRQDRIERRERGEMPEHIHGTVSGYINWGCLCVRCSNAGSANNRLYRENRKKREAEAASR